MSRPRGSGGDGSGVGKGKPPTEHRFKKGQSGNPNGRPRKVRSEVVRPLEQGGRDTFLSEAYREVTLNEGGKPTTLPMFQAVLRAMGVTALKGNAHAQKTYLQTLLELERRATDEHARLLVSAIEQKARLEEELRQWRADGRDEMDIPVHPSDIVIDGSTGEVIIYAAFTGEERQARAKLVELRDGQQAIIDRALAAADRGQDDGLAQIRREVAEEMFERINEQLPPRFRKQLKGRSQEQT